jgi:hypothetical protein
MAARSPMGLQWPVLPSASLPVRFAVSRFYTAANHDNSRRASRDTGHRFWRMGAVSRQPAGAFGAEGCTESGHRHLGGPRQGGQRYPKLLPARQCPHAAAREKYAAYCVAGLSDKLTNAGG